MVESLLTPHTFNTLPSGERRRVLASLVKEQGQAAVAALSSVLRESNWPVCDEIADVLVTIGGDNARGALKSAMKARRHHIRSAAVKALVRLGGTDIREAIVELKNDPSFEVRQDVAEAIRALDQRGE